MKVNERSSNTVISTGVIRPFWSAVCALNALQNSMMLTPAWPSAGPTGGAGFAWPPGVCSLTSLSTFLAMVAPSLWGVALLGRGGAAGRRAPGLNFCPRGVGRSDRYLGLEMGEET